MRLLLVGAGAAVSTIDVEHGYRDAFRALGVDLVEYDLGTRLGLGKRWLDYLWRARGKNPAERPSWADTLYRASVEALEMALRFEVDWVFVVSAMFLHPDALGLMRRAGLRTAVLFTESPYEDEQQARVAQLVDACWTTERTSVEYLRQAGSNPRTCYVQHAYDPARHAPTQNCGTSEVPAHDVVFVGTGFEERIALLETVDWSGIDLGLYGTWGLLPSRHKLRKYVRGGMTGNVKTAALYRQAKIGLNLYRSSAGYGRQIAHITAAESMNPRAYELAACGVFSLAERRAEQTEVFGWSVPTFDSAASLQLLLQRFLGDERARQHCVAAARERVAPHTFVARAAQVLADLDGRSSRAFEMPAVAGQKGA